MLLINIMVLPAAVLMIMMLPLHLNNTAKLSYSDRTNLKQADPLDHISLPVKASLISLILLVLVLLPASVN